MTISEGSVDGVTTESGRGTSEGDLAAAFSRFGHHLKLLLHERRIYAYDATGIVGVPDAVLHLRAPEDVPEAIRAARAAGVSLVARGSGTGLSGGCIGRAGMVALSFEHLRTIRSLDLDRFRLWVDAGVINQWLEAYLAPHDLFYAPDPASHRVSTLGGNIAENSGGPRALKYGVTGQHITRLQIVDATGREGVLVADETQPTLDLVSLVVGSEGTLALVSGAELALTPRPADVWTLLVSFPTMADATRFVSAVIAAGIVPSALEFLDRHSMDCVEEWGVAHYHPSAGAVLLLDIDGSREEIVAQSGRVRDLAASMGAVEVRVADDEGEREALWLGRRGVYAAVARRAKYMLTQDITVPRERLTEMLDEVGRIAASYGVHVATVGHAGDGNLHPDFGYDPDDGDTARRVHDANLEILKACVALGGSITGEHGIGVDKLPYLALMYGPEELGLMAAVKRALDPDGVLNPGKAIPMVERVTPGGGGRRRPHPRTAEEVRHAVLHASATGAALHLSLGEMRGIEVDVANVTVEVGAGEQVDDVEEALGATALRFPVMPMRETTVGRALLLNDYGPDHLDQGLFRHALLAATYVTGCGEVVRMGRAVMKNVAGYDLFRPLIGSAGRLAVPISFVFRLRPRSQTLWAERILNREEIFSRAEHRGLLTTFAVPEDGVLRVFGRFHRRAPTGWVESREGEERLRGVRAVLRTEDSVLDIAFAPRHLPTVLTLLPVEPLAILPGAARLFLPLDRPAALEITREVEVRTGETVRALWGMQREPLHRLGTISAEWQDRLFMCFDPAGILRHWLTEGKGE